MMTLSKRGDMGHVSTRICRWPAAAALAAKITKRSLNRAVNNLVDLIASIRIDAR